MLASKGKPSWRKKMDEFQAFMVDAMRQLLPLVPLPNLCGPCAFFTADPTGKGLCALRDVPMAAADLGCDNYQLARNCA